MKQFKTSELSGPALDWAVAKAAGHDSFVHGDYEYLLKGTVVWQRGGASPEEFRPSTDWSQGGPIIEREGISLRPIRKPGHNLDGQCLATIDHGNTGTMVQWVKRESFSRHYWKGPTPLIAAMRCYVASKLGDVVSIPEELA